MEKESWQRLLRNARAHVGCRANDDDDDEIRDFRSYSTHS
jgi:hypothetical protein